MKMYRLITEEIVKLLNMEMGDRSKFNPVKDVNGDWFISEVEHNVCGLGIESQYVAPESPTPLEG